MAVKLKSLNPLARLATVQLLRPCAEPNRQAGRALATNSSQWRAIRAAQLRKEPLCRECAKAGRTTAATDVDHIDGDSTNESPSNHQSLCHSCHSRKTATQDHGFGR